MEELYFNVLSFLANVLLSSETLPLLAKPLQKTRPKTLRKTMGSLGEVLMFMRKTVVWEIFLFPFQNHTKHSCSLAKYFHFTLQMQFFFWEL